MNSAEDFRIEFCSRNQSTRCFFYCFALLPRDVFLPDHLSDVARLDLQSGSKCGFSLEMSNGSFYWCKVIFLHTAQYVLIGYISKAHFNKYFVG